jgi:hypothetical protein
MTTPETRNKTLRSRRVSRQGVHHRSRGSGFIRTRQVAAVQPKEIDIAVDRKKRFESNPQRHTYEEV